jgi:heterodisulfide reductase subunit A
VARIGVFVCHCGENIAGTVDVERVAREAAEIKGVVHAVDYKFMCSDPGQKMIKDAIVEKGLTGVVVAACSPHMHETTFRRACAEAGLNPYRCEIANIREHCSWVHSDRELATQKAMEIVRLIVEKVKRNHELYPIRVPVLKRALVVGGGIAGIQAALDIANAGYDVVMVERSPSIGGRMAQLSETFPTLDCSQCILTPRMVEVKSNERIKLYTYSEVEDVAGFVGNFKVRIRKKARYVDERKCTGCGLCQQRCPVKRIPSEFDAFLGTRTAIYTPFPQAVPNVPVIDRENCLFFKRGTCRICEKVCPTKAISYEQEDEIIEEMVGAVVLATGYDVMDADEFGELGGGRFKDVITGLQFERILSSSGPTSGKILRPSDKKEVETVVFISCVGSRERYKGIEYCSKICCMYVAKHAMLFKHKNPKGKAYVFYMDIRAGGKGYEEFVRRAIEEEGVIYLRGRVSRIYERDGKLVVRGADSLSGTQVEIPADLVVLATAIRPKEGAESIAQKFHVSYDSHGFMNELHPKLRPVETATAGVFLAGVCQAPKDIPDSVAQASAAASKVLALFSSDELEREPTVAIVDESTCVGCFACESVCPFGAIERKEVRDRAGNVIKVVSHVNPGLCQGCGACVVACRSQCIDIEGYRSEEVFAEIMAL